MRRIGIWQSARQMHAATAPTLCRFLHSLAVRIGPHVSATNFALKHYYDFELIYVEPTLITGNLRVGSWRGGRRDSFLSPSGPIPKLKGWYTYGGAWKSLSRHPSRNIHSAFVCAGDWDLAKQRFEIRPTIVDVFVRGRRPEDTDEYRRLARWIEKGDFRWTRGCRSIDDVDRYFARMISIYHSIKKRGYRNQRDLGISGGDEIRVCVDRHGQLCVFGGGTHRLSMALVMDLPKIPVLVKRVHEEWVLRCQARFGGNRAEAIARGLSQVTDSSTSDSLSRPMTGARRTAC